MQHTTTDRARHDIDPTTEAVGTVEELHVALLGRSADATFLLDVETGLALQRWYDRDRSRLTLPGQSLGDKLIEWIHPDDLPEILGSFAAVVNAGTPRSAVVRMHPDRVTAANEVLMIRIQDVRDLTGNAALVQAWVADDDSIVDRDHDPSTSLSSLAAAAPVGLQVRAANGVVSFQNERFTRLVAMAPDEVESCIQQALHDRDGGDGQGVTDDLRVGDTWLRLRVVPTIDAEGRLVMAVASLEDVTQVQVAEAGRAQALKLFEAVFHSSPVATALVAVDGRFVRVNESFAVVTGYSTDELLARRFQDITHPADLAADEQLLAEVLDGTRPNYQMEKRYLHRAGHEVWVELTVAPVRGPDGCIEHLVSHVEDITSRRSAVARGDTDDLAYWATHDHLTALPNRRLLEHHLQVSLDRSRRADDTRPVVLFLDLDDFKPVNDDHGHVVGDEVLQITARRLRAACREDALVGRYGGDEFVVVAHRLRTVADVPVLVERIHDAVRAPITTSDATVLEVGVSVGISIARPGERAVDLLSRADAAAYRAKREGKNRACFDRG